MYEYVSTSSVPSFEPLLLCHVFRIETFDFDFLSFLIVVVVVIPVKIILWSKEGERRGRGVRELSGTVRERGRRVREVEERERRRRMREGQNQSQIVAR